MTAGAGGVIAVVADGKRHELARAPPAPRALGVRQVGAAIPALTAALARQPRRGPARWPPGRWPRSATPRRGPLIRAYFTRDDAARPVMAWALAQLAGAARRPRRPTATDYPLRERRRKFDARDRDLRGTPSTADGRQRRGARRRPHRQVAAASATRSASTATSCSACSAISTRAPTASASAG